MITLLRAETHRVNASTTTWILLAVTALVAALSTLLLVALEEDGVNMLSDNTLQGVMHGASVGAYLVPLVGCLAMAGDWRHGQVDNTFLTEPRRVRVVLARTAVHGIVGAMFGITASAAVLATAAATYAVEGLTLPLDRSAVWLTLAGVVAGSVLLCMVGVGVGAVLRNAVVGVVGILTWLFVVESIIYGASSSVGKWLPGTASTGLGRVPDMDVLSPAVAAAVLAGTALAVVALGARVVERSDVTA